MRRILYIGNKLERNGYSPTSIDTLPEKLSREGIKFLNFSSYQNKFLRLAEMILAVLQYGRKVDLILIDTYSTSNFWYAVICGYLGKIQVTPLIFILHGGRLEERFNRADRRIINLFKNARKNIVPSEFLMDRLDPLGFNNLKLIPNWIELKNYHFLKRNGVRPRLLWVRAFDEVYNPMMAIQVLEQLLKRNLEAELCMVGPEKDASLSRCRKYSEEKGLSVQFTGKMQKEEWLKLSKDFDIFLNTTNVDNTPVSVIEAMALGLPVVSTNVGGMPYLIKDGENGLLTEAGNADEMTEAIEKLLREPELAKCLSENARRKAEGYDWEKVKALWLELLG